MMTGLDEVPLIAALSLWLLYWLTLSLESSGMSSSSWYPRNIRLNLASAKSNLLSSLVAVA